MMERFQETNNLMCDILWSVP